MTDEKDVADVEWFLRAVVLYGANDVSVEFDAGHISGIRFRRPGGRDRYVSYAFDPARPCALEIRAGGER